MAYLCKIVSVVPSLGLFGPLSLLLMRFTSGFLAKVQKAFKHMLLHPCLGHLVILMFNQYLSATQRMMRNVHKVLPVRSTADGTNWLQSCWGRGRNPEEWENERGNIKKKRERRELEGENLFPVASLGNEVVGSPEGHCPFLHILFSATVQQQVIILFPWYCVVFLRTWSNSLFHPPSLPPPPIYDIFSTDGSMLN